MLIIWEIEKVAEKEDVEKLYIMKKNHRKQEYERKDKGFSKWLRGMGGRVYVELLRKMQRVWSYQH